MQTPLPHIQNGQHLWLSPERCIYWEEEKTLILSDLHFGKTGHFRKAGIAVPQHVYKEDLQRLVQIIQHFQPTHMIVVGDMFHSEANLELELFRKWRCNFPHLSIELVKGNHDILKNNWYTESQLIIHEETLNKQPFSFTHDVTKTSVLTFNQTGRSASKENLPVEQKGHKLSSGNYYFSGHIHPGINVHGGGRQSLRFPCFYFGASYAILPAFSRFTGTYLIEPKEKESVFAIVENKIVRLQ